METLCETSVQAIVTNPDYFDPPLSVEYNAIWLNAEMHAPDAEVVEEGKLPPPQGHIVDGVRDLVV